MVSRLLALSGLALLTIAAGASVPAAHTAPPAAPTGVHAFLLRADEAPQAAYPRTPSFAWTAYDGASGYDFELATSDRFAETSIVWQSDNVVIPAVAVPLSLPWMTGDPYALYARVRAHVGSGVTRWSAPFGFDMSWSTIPQQILPDIPGLVRWTPVEGATSYEVWFLDAGKVITTTTNVADEREYYTLHQDPHWSGVVHWRVRAVRTVYGVLPNALPTVSYGPWSSPYTSINPPVSTGPLRLLETASDVTGWTGGPLTVHALTPGFSFSGDTATNGVPGQLYRVYVATDRACVNTVFTGSIVGSPAWAPRTSGPLALPGASTGTATSYLSDGSQTATGADGTQITPNEQGGGSTVSAPFAPVSTDGKTAGTTTAAAADATSIPSSFTTSGPFVDLWDIGQPNGRYWWTVVPVVPTSSGYVDAEIPQDACEDGLVAPFGKQSPPAVTDSGAKPYVSALSPYGELTAAASGVPRVYRSALVAWQPAAGAIGYEVEWSRTKRSWKATAQTTLFTPATSVLLQGLASGVWYYRVRGIDPYVPGPIKQMAWSAPVEIRFVKPQFLIQSGVTTRHLGG